MCFFTRNPFRLRACNVGSCEASYVRGRYHIEHEDSDSEDVSEDDVEALLVPL
jgi:hypothetical protein